MHLECAEIAMCFAHSDTTKNVCAFRQRKWELWKSELFKGVTTYQLNAHAPKVYDAEANHLNTVVVFCAIEFCA